MTTLSDAFAIWSPEHSAFWRPDGAGYTNDPMQAALYSHQDAGSIPALQEGE